MYKIKFMDGTEREFETLVNANLRGAYLYGAILSYADLRGAYLYGANLSYASLRGADLTDADLSYANLRGANLTDADLRGADLRGANLRGAILRYSDLIGTKLPHFQICPEAGPFLAWKKITTGVIQIMIPDDALRTSSLVGRKCRASHVVVVLGITVPGCSTSQYSAQCLEYKQGETVYADSFDPDIRVECTHGIHFFMTRREAEEYVG